MAEPWQPTTTRRWGSLPRERSRAWGNGARPRITSYNVCYTKLLRTVVVDEAAASKLKLAGSYNFV
ncbi:hypothetical protein [Streptomyces cyaneogriseus]|uniref:hypothetical protein n=1 Tax=Streptomyces cyaneogriseus TaxID=68192 RepID=UPI0013313014|nr:hypothetical protein [Streptomyces cyaneogriseus]